MSIVHMPLSDSKSTRVIRPSEANRIISNSAGMRQPLQPQAPQSNPVPDHHRTGAASAALDSCYCMTYDSVTVLVFCYTVLCLCRPSVVLQSMFWPPCPTTSNLTPNHLGPCSSGHCFSRASVVGSSRLRETPMSFLKYH